VDHPISRVPEALHPHLTPTVRTDQWIPTRALRVPLAVGQPGNDLHGALHHPLDLRQRLTNQDLDLGKRLRGLHPVIADTLEAFGQRVLHLCGEVNYVARMTQMTILP